MMKNWNTNREEETFLHPETVLRRVGKAVSKRMCVYNFLYTSSVAETATDQEQIKGSFN